MTLRFIPAPPEPVSIRVSNTVHAWMIRHLGTPEEINGRNRCETYLYRWIVATIRRYKFYLHHFVRDDWSRDLHDHPKWFISIGLWGCYEPESGGGLKTLGLPASYPNLTSQGTAGETSRAESGYRARRGQECRKTLPTSTVFRQPIPLAFP